MPGDAAGDEVRTAAGAFLQKVAEQDAAGADAMFSGSSDEREWLRVQMRLIDVATTLRKQMVETFGPASETAQLPDVKSFKTSLVRLAAYKPVILNGDVASFCSASSLDRGLVLGRVKGTWVVTSLACNSTFRPSERAKDVATCEAMEGTLEGIKSGQLKTPKEATDHFGEAFRTRFLPLRDALTSSAVAAAPPARPAAGTNCAVAEGAMGKELGSEAVRRLVASLEGAPAIEVSAQALLIDDPLSGTRLGFDLPVRTLSFCSVRVTPESGPLPHGVSAQDRRREVERKLGAPPLSGGGDSLSPIYGAVYPPLGLTIKFLDPSAGGRDPAAPIIEIQMYPPARAAEGGAVAATSPAGPRLAFRLVAKDGTEPGPKEAEAMADVSDPVHARVLMVMREVLLDERGVAEVHPGRDPAGRTVTYLTMSKAAAATLRSITRENQGRRLAIVLDGQLLMAPTINGEIGDQVMISGVEGRDEQEMASWTGRLHAIIHALPPDTAATTAPVDARPR
jgi:hypothetical protein